MTDSQTLVAEYVRSGSEPAFRELVAHSASNLAKLAPLLDEAIEEVREEDRTAILLRFYSSKEVDNYR